MGCRADLLTFCRVLTYTPTKTKWPPVKQRRREDPQPAPREPHRMSSPCSISHKSKISKIPTLPLDVNLTTKPPTKCWLRAMDQLTSKFSWLCSVTKSLVPTLKKPSNAFKTLDEAGKGAIHKDALTQILTTQADRFNATEMQQMFGISPIDGAGMLDYKGLAYTLTHGQADEAE